MWYSSWEQLAESYNISIGKACPSPGCRSKRRICPRLRASRAWHGLGWFGEIMARICHFCFVNWPIVVQNWRSSLRDSKLPLYLAFRHKRQVRKISFFSSWTWTLAWGKCIAEYCVEWNTAATRHGVWRYLPSWLRRGTDGWKLWWWMGSIFSREVVGKKKLAEFRGRERKANGDYQLRLKD